ncbi:MAG: HAD family hydrolase [Thermoproteota archaeon]
MIKAVFFDLHGTLAYIENPISEIEISDYLFSKGYEVSSQQLRAAWFFVAMVDYPRYGYRNWYSYFSRVFWRLKVKVNEETLNTVVRLLESKPYQLYPDATNAVINIKKSGFKTAIITTIAYFQFKKAIHPIKSCLDLIMTGYEAGCDKSNPKMYKKTLEILNVKPEEAVMVGDSAFIDIIIPKALGIKTILLNRNCKAKCKQADATIKNLNYLLKKLNKFT